MSNANACSLIAAHLSDVNETIREVSESFDGVTSTVMDPERTVITLKMNVKQAVKGIVEQIAAEAAPPTEECPADPVAAVRWTRQNELHSVLISVAESKYLLMEMLEEKLTPMLADEMNHQYDKAYDDHYNTLEAIKARAKRVKTTLAKAAKKVKDAEAVALEGTSKGLLSLKIVGVGGIDQAEAKAKYLTAREKLTRRESWQKRP